MKMNFEIRKQMSGVNPDGKTVILSENAKVRIKYADSVNLSEEFKRLHPDNMVNAKIVTLRKNSIECVVLDDMLYMLTLKPAQIIEIKNY